MSLLEFGCFEHMGLIWSEPNNFCRKTRLRKFRLKIAHILTLLIVSKRNHVGSRLNDVRYKPLPIPQHNFIDKRA